MNGCQNKGDNPRFSGFIAGRIDGFTLFELLVAVAIFALMTVALYGAVNSLVSNTATLEKTASVYESARICIDRMVRDLESVYVSQPPAYEPPGFDSELDPYRFTADSNGGEASVRFTAFSHIVFSHGINVKAGRIAYYLYRQAGSDTGELMRSDTVLQYESTLQKGRDPVVCENVESFELVFYDADGQEFDHWDSESREFGYATPKMVKVKIVIKEGERLYPFETMVSMPVYRERID